ncbi:barstar family protein [Gordonia phthalatica]|uniref:Barstar (barnase inhibitor) domain-containing protein n=1 Tax=Gordonia phthalatica TaxID=1136941 RepID=A0A0N9N8H3_9ACTN|nr:barstar family protein [Gordonia phthalatica]ALG83553.1 hypothetical protein ACH46_02315 [Gordonia phthalatica]
MSAALPADFLTSGPGAALAVGDVDTYGTGAAVRRLSGAAMRTVDGLYDAFAAAWDFPAHFGFNKDAFDDVIGDLPAGLRTSTGAIATGVLTIIDDAGLLLADATDDDREWFATSPSFWRERCARGGRGFGIVLLADDAAVDVVEQRWRAAGGELIRLRQD